MKLRKTAFALLGSVCLALTGCSAEDVIDGLQYIAEFEELVQGNESSSQVESPQESLYILDDSEYHIVSDLYGIEWYYGEPWTVVNDNVPLFDVNEYSDIGVFEWYSDLDELGRCSEAFANICTDLMPTEERGDISSIKPSGWQTAKYDCVSGKYLYNRCHLIGFQLAGENANELNLITGTRYLNIDGMLEFENLVADYVKETDNHVLYRVTPIFTGENLIADGVLMEAYSIEDGGEGVEFCVFAYNVQPGIEIDYATGDSSEK